MGIYVCIFDILTFLFSSVIRLPIYTRKNIVKTSGGGQQAQNMAMTKYLCVKLKKQVK